MAEIKCDTKKIRNIGENIVSETKELQLLFEKMYSSIYSIQRNNVWLGHASNHFINSIANDGNNMGDFCNELQKYGTKLVDVADNYDYLVTKHRGIK